MFWQKTKEKSEDYLFDFQRMNFVVDRVMHEYVLQGKLKDYNRSFLIVCDKDNSGNEISLNYTLGQLEKIAHNNEGDTPAGLTFGSFPDAFSLLEQSQWFARVNYHEPITIISAGEKTEYRLSLPHHEKSTLIPPASIYHYSDEINVHYGGPFQGDKLFQDKVLISEIDSKRLDEMIREIYVDRISETYK